MTAGHLLPTAPGLCAGIDIGGTKLDGVVLGPGGEVLARHRVPTVPSPQAVLDGAVEVLTGLAGRAGVAVSGLGSVGVGTAGVVDERTGTVSHAVNLGIDGDGLALAAGLADRTGLPARVENDVNAAAVGAYAALGAPAADLALLSIGTGVAAGLVLGGRLRRGARGAAGEIGHIPVVADGPRCSCGQSGCLEAVASGRALTRRWEAAGGSPHVPAAQAVFAAAAQGEPAARALREEFTRYLAVAVRTLVLTVDVDLVVLGGGVAATGQALLTGVREALRAQAVGSPLLAGVAAADRVRLVPADRPVAAMGAALLGRLVEGAHA